MVICPLSTMVIEALCEGVNAYIYEPLFENKNIFDKSWQRRVGTKDDGLLVAYDAQQLTELIKSRKLCDVKTLDLLKNYQNSWNTDLIEFLLKKTEIR